MAQLVQATLTVMDDAFKALEKQVPPPREVERKRGFVYRYVEKSIQQAIILKLARMTSDIRAALLLLDRTFHGPG